VCGVKGVCTCVCTLVLYSRTALSYCTLVLHSQTALLNCTLTVSRSMSHHTAYSPHIQMFTPHTRFASYYVPTHQLVHHTLAHTLYPILHTSLICSQQSSPLERQHSRCLSMAAPPRSAALKMQGGLSPPHLLTSSTPCTLHPPHLLPTPSPPPHPAPFTHPTCSLHPHLFHSSLSPHPLPHLPLSSPSLLPQLKVGRRLE
jgi:hypothetical protein